MNKKNIFDKSSETVARQRFTKSKAFGLVAGVVLASSLGSVTVMAEEVAPVSGTTNTEVVTTTTQEGTTAGEVVTPESAPTQSEPVVAPEVTGGTVGEAVTYVKDTVDTETVVPTTRTEVEAEITETTSDIANVEATEGRLETKVQELETELNKETNNVDSLNKVVSDSTKTITDTTNQVNSKTSELKTVESNISTNETKLADLNKQVTAKEAEVSNKQATVTSLEKEVASMPVTDESKKLQEVVNNKRTEVTTAQTNYNNALEEEKTRVANLAEVDNTIDLVNKTKALLENNKTVFSNASSDVVWTLDSDDWIAKRYKSTTKVEEVIYSGAEREKVIEIDESVPYVPNNEAISRHFIDILKELRQVNGMPYTDLTFSAEAMDFARQRVEEMSRTEVFSHDTNLTFGGKGWDEDLGATGSYEGIRDDFTMAYAQILRYFADYNNITSSGLMAYGHRISMLFSEGGVGSWFEGAPAGDNTMAYSATIFDVGTPDNSFGDSAKMNTLRLETDANGKYLLYYNDKRISFIPPYVIKYVSKQKKEQRLADLAEAQKGIDKAVKDLGTLNTIRNDYVTPVDTNSFKVALDTKKQELVTAENNYKSASAREAKVAQLNTAKGDLTKLQGEVSNLKGQVSSTQSTISQLKGTQTQLKTEIANLETTLKNAQTQLKQANSTLLHVEGVNKELATVQGMLKDIQSLKVERTAYLSTLNTKLEEIKEEEARIKAEQEAKAKAEEEARIKAEQEAKAKAEEEARIKAEQEAKAKAEEEARIQAEQNMLTGGTNSNTGSNTTAGGVTVPRPLFSNATVSATGPILTAGSTQGTTQAQSTGATANTGTNTATNTNESLPSTGSGFSGLLTAIGAFTLVGSLGGAKKRKRK